MSSAGKDIVIIGAGPSGLAAAKAIGSEPDAKTVFNSIDVYERTGVPGGLWNYTPVKTHVKTAVPSQDIPHSGEFSDKPNQFVSPMYENLETNLPNDLMRYNGLDFPEGTRLFPTRSQVADYLHLYAKTIPDNVAFHYNANVISLTKKGSKWELVVQDTVSGKSSTKLYDDAVLAQGHFETPFIPDVPGLKYWGQKDPESVTHSKYFTNVIPYKDKTVLVVGSFASGLDVSNQLLTYAKSVALSSDSESPYASVFLPQVKQVAKVEKYDYDDNRTAYFTDGTKLEGIDVILYCTGYLYTVPFLKSYTSGPQAIVTDGVRMHNLYEQIFYIPDPSLILIAVQQAVVPFPFAECESQYVARILSGRLQLPSQEEMQKSYDEEIQRKGTSRLYHKMDSGQDWEYCNRIFDILGDTADTGFVAEYWTEARQDRRKNMHQLKLKRVAKTADRVLELRAAGKPFELAPDAPESELGTD